MTAVGQSVVVLCSGEVELISLTSVSQNVTICTLQMVRRKVVGAVGAAVELQSVVVLCAVWGRE
jgi:hypothetical protein